MAGCFNKSIQYGWLFLIINIFCSCTMTTFPFNIFVTTKTLASQSALIYPEQNKSTSFLKSLPCPIQPEEPSHHINYRTETMSVHIISLVTNDLFFSVMEIPD